MAEFFDYDPVSGLTYKLDWSDEDRKVTVRSEQDCQPILDHMARLRNSNKSEVGIKNDWWFYCTIPPSVELILRDKYGLNINDKNHLPRALKVIDRDFPYLKATTKRHVLQER